MRDYILAVGLFVTFLGGFFMAWILRPAIEVPAPVVQEKIESNREVWIYNGKRLPHCGLSNGEEPCQEFGRLEIPNL